MNTPVVRPIVQDEQTDTDRKPSAQKTHMEKLALASKDSKNLYHSICDYIESLGDDVTSNQLKFYLAYKKIQNIVCIEIFNKQIIAYLKLNPDTVKIEEGFTRDMRKVSHNGTGNLQVTIKNAESFEKAKPLIERAYNEG